MTTLKTWAKWAKWPTDELAEYTPPVPARPKPHPLPEGIEGVLAMIAVAKNNRQVALVSLCGLVGLRVSEAIAVTPACFDTGEMILTVRGKGDKTRDVPLSRRAWAEIAPAVADAVLDGTPTIVGYKDRFARQLLTNLAKRAALQRKVSSHDLRATFATATYDKTLNIRAVQELMGHASSHTTETYVDVTMDTMRGAVEIA